MLYRDFRARPGVRRICFAGWVMAYGGAVPLFIWPSVGVSLIVSGLAVCTFSGFLNQRDYERACRFE